ncbi:MAG: adenylosuccinate lyase [Fimbriimonadaceae bacterium]|nr:adenylosuccinate lyase [Fimbriimonadaceae bacterium]
MIDRYCTPAMSAIWDRQAKYQRWLEAELAICEVYFEDGVIPAPDWEDIRTKSKFSIERCDEIELETRHDLVAFVRNLEENVGPAGRWIHFGVTSYDVIDTALGMMLRDSCTVLLESADKLGRQIARLADEHKDTPCIGRTHAIHAEPVTFGAKAAGWWHELQRNIERIKACQKDVAVGKISGAVGIHAHVSPDMEKRVLAKLGLEADPISTQIVNRDRLANLLCTIAVMAGGLERIATELRNLQRTEILEVQEEFAKGQTGSSAMPHKRNPWNSETVCGLARIVRGNAHAMLETIATWHERDLTNSSMERIILPDTFHLADFMLNRLTRILTGLVVMPENMKTNLRKMGDLVFSEHIMVALVGKGMPRADAYKVAQRNAAKAWDGEDFKTSVANDEDMKSRFTPEEIDELFSLEHHLRNAHHNLPPVA